MARLESFSTLDHYKRPVDFVTIPNHADSELPKKRLYL